MVCNYKIIIEYDGTHFHGFQKQKNAPRTIQDELEAALKIINDDKVVSVNGSGRTDAQVHALNQVCTFALDMELDEDKLRYRLNNLLPEDIYVKEVVKVADDFHARYHAVSKHYQYRLNMGSYNVFERNYAYQHNKSLDIEAMQKASEAFIGKKDFRSFSSATSKQDTIKEVFKIDFKVENDLLIVDFYGSGFLRYMVRKMMMALIDAGQNKLDAAQILEILNQKNINFYSKVARPEGLYLVAVLYE